jgi:GTPase SAR1 family protein
MSATLQKKICMLGGFSVGKTSLVKRYVQSVFSETYLTTVGVKIDKKTVDLPDRSVSLILWDLAGEDDISSLRMSYTPTHRRPGRNSLCFSDWQILLGA